ncbi:hypothetical protein LXL04_023796 [Taraxacum kok-saghyz]
MAEKAGGAGDLQHAIELQNRRIVDLQLRVFREQGLILAALMGLSAFFSMAETSITTLSPWKVRELAEKEDENGVFKLLRTDITQFLTTILIGTTSVDLQLRVFREQGLILAALLGLSAFFSMAETSTTTLSPWKVRELAEKEDENGVFKLLRTDITQFLTTILIGTTVVNIGATALFTEAATTVFGEAGVSAATGVMTVVVLLLTEITPKSIAVHNATAVARAVVRPVAWLSIVLYQVGRVVTFLSMGMLKILGLKGKSEPSVTEDELKLMLRVANWSGAIEEEEQDMIENVLEIKDTHVKEVMTPLVDVVAVDFGATLLDFHHLWVTNQYSRVPVFEQRIDNIVGVAYAMDLLDLVQKGEMLETAVVGEIAHKPAYFVLDSMLVWNLLREFHIRKVHMAVVLNEYGGTVGIVTLEDVVEEIVGEIFDENDSKEETDRKNREYCKGCNCTSNIEFNNPTQQHLPKKNPRNSPVKNSMNSCQFPNQQKICHNRKYRNCPRHLRLNWTCSIPTSRSRKKRISSICNCSHLL